MYHDRLVCQRGCRCVLPVSASNLMTRLRGGIGRSSGLCPESRWFGCGAAPHGLVPASGSPGTVGGARSWRARRGTAPLPAGMRLAVTKVPGKLGAGAYAELGVDARQVTGDRLDAQEQLA